MLYMSVMLLMFGCFQGLVLAPSDAVQGDVYRIIYLHIPMATLSLSLYLGMAVMSVIYLIWHIKLADILAEAMALFGVVYTVLAIVTGSIWGKPTWGTWWIWDARLTSETVLLFLFLGYIALRKSIVNKQQAAKAAAIIGIIGAIDVPIIHYSVQWWHTLHQGPSILTFGSKHIATEMLIPIVVMLLGFYLLTASMVLYRAESIFLLKKLNKM